MCYLVEDELSDGFWHPGFKHSFNLFYERRMRSWFFNLHYEVLPLLKVVFIHVAFAAQIAGNYDYWAKIGRSHFMAYKVA